jgi:hypothetical protein
MASKVTKLPTKPVAGTVHWLNECIERGKREPFAEVITLSPALAHIILANNPDNRNIRPVKVRHFASDMRAGRWPLNGETIIIADSGELNDGQHRLAGLIDANVTVPATLFFGAKRETRTTVDQGSARGAGAYLRMEGVPYAETAAGVARMILAYEDGNGATLATGNKFTAASIVDRAKRDAGVQEAINATAAFAHDGQPYGLPHSIVAFGYYVFAREDEHSALDFMKQVVLGENLRAGLPAYVLRSKLLNNRYTRDEKVELLFRAWNFARRGTTTLKPSSMASLGNLPSVM